MQNSGGGSKWRRRRGWSRRGGHMRGRWRGGGGGWGSGGGGWAGGAGYGAFGNGSFDEGGNFSYESNYSGSGDFEDENEEDAGADETEYSIGWWYASNAGRQLWDECQKAGESSDFWQKNSCGTHGDGPEEYSEWWWWTPAGDEIWEQCVAQGPESTFWVSNKCEDGR